MNHTLSSVLKGAAAGAVLGTAAYMAMGNGKHKGKQMKKKASKAIKTVGSIFENISYMI